jgi:hypothetical protein
MMFPFFRLYTEIVLYVYITHKEWEKFTN